MIIAIDPGQPFEYVPLSERDKPDPSSFTFRPLTSVDRVELSSITAGAERPGAQTGALAIAVVRRCLIGWKLKAPNPKKGEGEAELVDVPLLRDWHGVTRESLARLPAELLYEFSNELFDREAITRADVGKS